MKKGNFGIQLLLLTLHPPFFGEIVAGILIKVFSKDVSIVKIQRMDKKLIL